MTDTNRTQAETILQKLVAEDNSKFVEQPEGSEPFTLPDLIEQAEADPNVAVRHDHWLDESTPESHPALPMDQIWTHAFRFADDSVVAVVATYEHGDPSRLKRVQVEPKD